MNIPQPQICLAPLRGLTGAVFRNTYAHFFNGIDRAVAPFLSTIDGMRIKLSQLTEVLPENNGPIPVVPQILSKTADHFIHLARALQDLGYDTVNWNLGCPFPRVARKQRGSGLLPHPDLVDAFLEKVLAATSVRISIKARLGRSQADEIFALIPVFNRYPIQELIIHPRTGIQMYAGLPDLDTFETCLPLIRCSVTYNGDINTKAHYDRLRERFPTITTWMIGRGTVSNPFLPALIKGLVKGEVDWVAQFRQFHDCLYGRYAQVRHGPAHLVDSMKGYWNYFAGSFAKGEGVLKQVRKARSAAHYQEIVKRFFETEAQEHYFRADNPSWCSKA
ncbi:MAG: tRNA-dihydrouridine synthase family protein [Desulfobacteraceae bacterium]|nr:MAG: tRNA-dihydrouridine synthase family protein [Desulfobacteraceae bacterium]